VGLLLTAFEGDGRIAWQVATIDRIEFPKIHRKGGHGKLRTSRSSSKSIGPDAAPELSLMNLSLGTHVSQRTVREFSPGYARVFARVGN